MLLANIISEKELNSLDNVKRYHEFEEECKAEQKAYIKSEEYSELCREDAEFEEELYLENISFGNPNADTDCDLPF
jgi:hypothetical protein